VSAKKHTQATKLPQTKVSFMAKEKHQKVDIDEVFSLNIEPEEAFGIIFEGAGTEGEVEMDEDESEDEDSES
jgi:hypothetical protein